MSILVCMFTNKQQQIFSNTFKCTKIQNKETIPIPEI